MVISFHFLIPFLFLVVVAFSGMCSSTRQSDGGLVATNCPQVPKIISLLKESPFFERKKGRDHIMFHSINHMMLFFANKKCQDIYRYCQNCIKFAIDYYDASLYRELKRLPHLTNNWISVPFPSNYHLMSEKVGNFLYASEKKITVWKRIKEDPSYLLNGDEYFKERKYSFCFIANSGVTAKKQKQLRIALFDFCKKYPRDCYYYQLSSHSSNVNHLTSAAVGKPSKDRLVSLFQSRSSHRSRALSASSSSLNESIHHFNSHAYEQCRLCFIPGGDFPTRKAFFDSMLSGCIPIIFQLETAVSQWKYHWKSQANALSSVLFFPREKFLSNSHETNYNGLMKIAQNITFLQLKLLSIAEIGNRFQYNHYDNEINLKYPTKDSDKDAFDVMIDILKNTVILPL
jgi:hypothetical protein